MKKTFPKTAKEVPEFILEDLYVWLIRGKNLEYIRDKCIKRNLITIHIIGGGMDIRNFLRKYPGILDMDCHWLDNNWIDIIKRMFLVREGLIL